MRNSLGVKFGLSYVAIIAALLVMMNTYPLMVSSDLVFRAKEASMPTSVSVMVYSISGLETLTEENVAEALAVVEETGLSRILVTDSAARVLYDTRETNGAVGDYALYTEVIQALLGSDAFTCAYRDGAFRSRAAVPISYRGMIIGSVYLYEYDTEQGALLVGLTFFALSMSCGYVAMAYGGSTGGEAIYRRRDASEYHLREIYLADDPYDTLWLCPDEEALYDCLASLELCRLTGSYAYEDGRRFTLLYDTPEGLQVVVLQDETAEIVPLYDGGRSERYYIPGGMDWAELDEVIIAGPALNLSFREPISGGDHRIGATLCQLTGTRGWTSVSLLSEFPQEVNGAFGYDVQAVTLDFSRPLVSGFRVDVQPESGGTGYSLFQWELDDPYVLPLADFPARYTVSAMLKGEQGGIYDAVFQFDFGDVD